MSKNKLKFQVPELSLNDSNSMFSHGWILSLALIRWMKNLIEEVKFQFKDEAGHKWQIIIKFNPERNLLVTLGLASNQTNVRAIVKLLALQNFGTVKEYKSETIQDFGCDGINVECVIPIDREIKPITLFCKIELETAASSSPMGEILFNKLEYTDFIIAVGDQVFPIHKAVLSSRSEVFAAMFKHKTTEQHTNCAEIVDFTPDVIQEMLRYIYTNEAPNINEMAVELLAAADKYAMDELRRICIDVLVQKITIENASDMLILADGYNAAEWKSILINFINSNRRSVMATNSWKCLRKHHPELIGDIYELMDDGDLPNTSSRNMSVNDSSSSSISNTTETEFNALYSSFKSEY